MLNRSPLEGRSRGLRDLSLDLLGGSGIPLRSFWGEGEVVRISISGAVRALTCPEDPSYSSLSRPGSLCPATDLPSSVEELSKVESKA